MKASLPGYYWSYARRYWELTAGGEGGKLPRPDTIDFSQLDDVLTGNGYFHTLQVGAAVDVFI